MIVIEGMDNSGKSTLGAELADRMGLFVQESEGPPVAKDGMSADEEINARVDRYETMTNYLFVRHPVVSNSIYGKVREEGDPITPGRQMIFYDKKPLLVYCDAGTRGLGAHVQKAHDTEKHLADIENHYNKLLYLYRVWAAERANFVYRIGDDMDEVCAAIAFLYHYRNS